MIFGHRFIRPKPKTVIINDLEWQYEDDGIVRNWVEASMYAQSLGHDWKLPTIRELSSIVNFSRCNPACNSKLICRSSNYWSSSTSALNCTRYAWVVNFYDGTVTYSNKTNLYYVRCVRSIEKRR
jgi:hypothetical protein